MSASGPSGPLVLFTLVMLNIFRYSKTDLKRPLKMKTKNWFLDQLSLNASQKYCRMLQESILQYFPPSLSYHVYIRPLFCLFFEWPLKTGFLYYIPPHLLSSEFSAYQL